jgi:hypothetical protein
MDMKAVKIVRMQEKELSLIFKLIQPNRKKNTIN